MLKQVQHDVRRKKYENKKNISYSFYNFCNSSSFSGCSNLFESVEKSNDSSQVLGSSSQKGRLLFSADSGARAANTVNPALFNFTSDAGLSFTLTGTLDGTTSTIGTWSDSDDSKAYSLMSSDNSILVDVGS